MSSLAPGVGGVDPALGWSRATFALAAAGGLATVATVVGTDSDPAGVLWPVLVAPLALAALAAVRGGRGARLAAALALLALSAVAAASVGLFFLPATVAAFGALVRTRAHR